MALEERDRNGLNNRERSLVRMRSISNYVMGVVLIGAGFFFVFPVAATRPFLEKYDELSIKLLGIICWIYGLFRIYRGYKKNYFRES